MYCGPQNFGSRTAYGLYRYDEAKRISVLLDTSRILMSPFSFTPAIEIYFKFTGIFSSPARNRLQVFPWLLSQWTLFQCSPADSDLWLKSHRRTFVLQHYILISHHPIARWPFCCDSAKPRRSGWTGCFSRSTHRPS